MSLTGMTVRRMRKLLAWIFALAVLTLIVAGALAVAFAVTGTPLPEIMVML